MPDSFLQQGWNALMPQHSAPMGGMQPNPGMGGPIHGQQPNYPALDGFDWNALSGMDKRGQRGYVDSYASQHPGVFTGEGDPFHQLRHMMHSGWNPPQIPGMPQTTPQVLGTPAVTPQLPQSPQMQPGMVGTSLGVIGATPASSPFGLPTY